MPDSDAAAMGIAPLVSHRIPAFTFADGWLNAHYLRSYVDRAVIAGDSRLTAREQAAIVAFQSICNHPDFMIEYLLEPEISRYSTIERSCMGARILKITLKTASPSPEALVVIGRGLA